MQPAPATRRCPRRAARRPVGTANAAAMSGPGASEKPAVRADSCQTPVRNSTLLSSIAANAAPNRSIAALASAKERTASSERSMTGAGSRAQRRRKTAPGEHRAGQAAERARVRPAPLGRLYQAQRERADREREHAGAPQIGDPHVRVAALAQDPDCEQRRRERDRQVDEEHQAPVGRDQQPAERRAGGGRDAADGGPDSDRRRSLPRIELGQQQRERGRDQERGADRLHDSRDDQRRRGRRRTAQQRAQREHGKPGDERAPASEAVGERAGGHQQGGEDDRVRVQHPRQAADARSMEAVADRRQGDVDDEQVEARHEDGG